ncbi:MAG: hypothetical protein KDD49_09775 [Bacteroidetes bacterium]|nr:hypothetical protein [Bacteroidota bacterium]
MFWGNFFSSQNRTWESGIKEKIEEQTLKSSSVRDTPRTLKINKNTVMAHLKKKYHNK